MATEYVIRDGRRIEVETLESRVAPKKRRRVQITILAVPSNG